MGKVRTGPRPTIRSPAAYAVDRDPVREHDVRAMPTTVFLTADGRTFDRLVGLLREDLLRSQIRVLLASSS